MPLLSLILPAKNDSYMGDFRWRLETTLNYLAYSLATIGRLNDVEVLVGDWGSEKPIHEVIALSEEARSLCSFVVVPPEFAKVAQKDSPFPIPIIQNIALRRATGTYLAQTDSDIVYPELTLSRLLSILDGSLSCGVDTKKALMVCSRRNIPYEMSESRANIFEVQKYVSRYGTMLGYDKLIPGFSTPSGMAILHRDLWYAAQGYDERLIYWGWMEIDLYFRFTQQVPWCDLDNYGVNLYHIEHYPNRNAQPRKMNPMLVSESFTANDSSWGFAEQHFPIAKASTAHYSAESHNAPRFRLEKLRACGPQGIENGLRDLEITKSCAERIVKLQKHLFITEALIAEVKRYENLLTHATPPTWDFRSALVWYTRNFRPLRYLEIGSGATDASFQVAAEFRPISIYTLGKWPSPAAPALIQGPGVLADVLAKELNHAGYVRLISGEEIEGLARFLKDSDESSAFDLVCLSPLWGVSESCTQIVSFLPRITWGGACVIVTPDDAYTDLLCDELRPRKETHEFFMCLGVRCLLLLRII